MSPGRRTKMRNMTYALVAVAALGLLALAPTKANAQVYYGTSMGYGYNTYYYPSYAGYRNPGYYGYSYYPSYRYGYGYSPGYYGSGYAVSTPGYSYYSSYPYSYGGYGGYYPSYYYGGRRWWR
jgi:hypothetical protein